MKQIPKIRVFGWIVGLILGLSACVQPSENEIQVISGNGTSELDIPPYFSSLYQIPDDNPLTDAGVELGRMLFYEKRLSGNNTMSCGTCHQQKFAFTDGGNRFSKGIDSTEGDLNTMSLVNLMWQNRFFWNGRSETLEIQALEPIQNPIEMHETLGNAVQKLQKTDFYPSKFKEAFGSEIITAENIGKAIAQFERTLISSNSKYDKYWRGEYQLTELELLGEQLFFTHPEARIGLRGGNCGDCHLGPLTSGNPVGFDGFHNNGLDSDENLRIGLQEITENSFDKGKFKTPSLRNIALTAPYMHDGRFQTLEEVLDHYNEHIQNSETLDPLIREASNEVLSSEYTVKLYLTEMEKKAILAFLATLTDEDFITDERFSDPFAE